MSFLWLLEDLDYLNYKEAEKLAIGPNNLVKNVFLESENEQELIVAENKTLIKLINFVF